MTPDLRPRTVSFIQKKQCSPPFCGWVSLGRKFQSASSAKRHLTPALRVSPDIFHLLNQIGFLAGWYNRRK